MKCVMCTRKVLHGMNTTSMSFEQFTNTVESIAPYYAILNGIGEPLDKLAASCPTWVRSPSTVSPKLHTNKFESLVTSIKVS
jgi:hypothetical protein